MLDRTARIRAYDDRISALAKVAENAAGSETASRTQGDLKKMENSLEVVKKDIADSIEGAKSAITANRNSAEVNAGQTLLNAAERLQEKVDGIGKNITKARELGAKEAADRVIYRGDTSSRTPLNVGDHYKSAVTQLTDEFFSGTAPLFAGAIQTGSNEIDASKPHHTTWTGHTYGGGEVLCGVVRTAGQNTDGSPHHRHDIYFRGNDHTKLQGHRQRKGLHTIPNDMAMQMALDTVINYKNDVNLLKEKTAHINARILTPDAVEALQIMCAIHNITDLSISGAPKMAKDALMKGVKVAKEIYRGKLLTVDDALSVKAEPSRHDPRRSP
jgi:hypothetical protein